MINITLSFPEFMIQKIDMTRGDVNRSKYVLRLIEVGYQNLESQNKNLHHPKFRDDLRKISSAEGVDTKVV